MKALLAYIGLVVAIAILLAFRHSVNRHTPQTACQGLKWLVKEAAECSAFPQAWEEWDRLNADYGNNGKLSKGVNGCAVLREQVDAYGIYENAEGSKIMDIFIRAMRESREEDIDEDISEALGNNFCKLAVKYGWSDKYLRLRPPADR